MSQGNFCRKFMHFWCTISRPQNGVGVQKWQISGMIGHDDGEKFALRSCSAWRQIAACYLFPLLKRRHPLKKGTIWYVVNAVQFPQVFSEPLFSAQPNPPTYSNTKNFHHFVTNPEWNQETKFWSLLYILFFTLLIFCNRFLIYFLHLPSRVPTLAAMDGRTLVISCLFHLYHHQLFCFSKKCNQRLLSFVPKYYCSV